jgi:hypothetical protein
MSSSNYNIQHNKWLPNYTSSTTPRHFKIIQATSTPAEVFTTCIPSHLHQCKSMGHIPLEEVSIRLNHPTTKNKMHSSNTTSKWRLITTGPSHKLSRVFLRLRRKSRRRMKLSQEKKLLLSSNRHKSTFKRSK